MMTSEVDDGDQWGDVDDDQLLQAAMVADLNDSAQQTNTTNPKTSDATSKRKVDDHGDGAEPVAKKLGLGLDREPAISHAHPTEIAEQSMVVPLHAHRRGYLWVSDFTSQCWCEQQMVYNFTVPGVVVENPAMTAGSNLHLARELEVQDKVSVKVTSSEDIFAIKLINLLGAINSFLVGIPVRREIPVFGAPFNDVFIMGLVDEIRCDPETFDLDLIELKTRKMKQLPSKHQRDAHWLQVMLYKKLFDDLVLGETNKDTLVEKLHLQLDKPFGEDIKQQLGQESGACLNLDQLFERLTAALKCVPCIAQCLVEYCYQADSSTIAVQTVEYDEVWLQERLHNYLAYWRGQRESVGVEIEEAWKCQRCDFADMCEWRQKKADQCQQKNGMNC